MASNEVVPRQNLASNFIRYWLPVLLMIGLMYYASTDVLSGENTRNAIEDILRWFVAHPSNRTIARMNFWVRKSAHFTEYAVLAWLLFRAFRADSPDKWKLRWFGYSLAGCAVWAALDEFHQTFTRSRGGSPYDSLLDSTGALVILLVIALYYVRKNRRAGRNAAEVSQPVGTDPRVEH
jgi:VanZ family protein